MHATFTVHIQDVFMMGSDRVVGVTMGVSLASVAGDIQYLRHSSRSIR